MTKEQVKYSGDIEAICKWNREHRGDVIMVSVDDCNNKRIPIFSRENKVDCVHADTEINFSNSGSYDVMVWDTFTPPQKPKERNWPSVLFDRIKEIEDGGGWYKYGSSRITNEPFHLGETKEESLFVKGAWRSLEDVMKYLHPVDIKPDNYEPAEGE